ncbi:hypothetical protein QJ850_gp755 [Acanthamoeba polyphaga mimivirus]|uniref:Uncharacterized protein n=1 Tax=Acanthamoeba polyphaga mimivirus Kroon TaxID=3069720 RepID=A0A0G2Y5T0_9VIRU|nr:hypothetical protein QJ850_gp755 [Acanthamoeba polyphaga mimivirus]AKI79944.1 hypothetical protein [Acanthamoeba polyphaga mimivirus Kroon]
MNLTTDKTDSGSFNVKIRQNLSKKLNQEEINCNDLMNHMLNYSGTFMIDSIESSLDCQEISESIIVHRSTIFGENLDEKFPDRMRPNSIICKHIGFTSNSLVKVALSEPGFKEKYFHADYNLLGKILTKIDNYKKFNRVSITSIINNNSNNKSDNILIEYCNKIYTLCDSYMILYCSNKAKLVEIIKKLLDKCFLKLHIAYRVVIYVSFHLVVLHEQKSLYCTTIVEKVKEFQKESRIVNYFLKEELEDYLNFAKKYEPTQI